MCRKPPSAPAMRPYSKSLAVGFRFGSLGFGFRRRLRFRFGGRLALGAGGRRRRRGILFGRFLVAFAAVIRDVKAAAFENDPRAGADGAFDFPLAPTFHAAFVF